MRQTEALAGRTGVFDDRTDAGRALAQLLAGAVEPDALVLAVPSGGVPVALEVASALGLELDVAVVSKVTLPWNTEVGCGAVAFDGTVQVDQEYADAVGLHGAALHAAVEHTAQKVARRVALYRAGRPAPPLAGRTVVLVDDGVASGGTLRLAAQAVRRAGAARVVAAVPTGHTRALKELERVVDLVVCANVRGPARFAVADAYRDWRDEDEQEMALRVEAFHARAVGAAAP